MDELVDFEELIDLNLSLPSVSQSSQEPITEVLDKMCEAMDESNLSIYNAFKVEIAPDDDIVNLDEFEHLFASASSCNNESNLVTDDLLEINDNDMAKILDDDTIDLDKFENISANACLFIDFEDEIDKGNNDISNLKKVSSYTEVPVEFETNACGHKTESDVIKKQNITSAYKYTLKTISVESTVISSEKEIDNYIDLEAFEFGTVNPVSNKLKIVNKEFENGLETVKAECKTETNIAEIIVSLTTNNGIELKYENGIETSKKDCKNTIDTINEYTNSNSDDDYDPLDFEFISEQEACKAGIVTRMSKTINATNATVTNNTQSTSKNVDNKLQTQQQNCTGQSTSNIDNRIRKNEASLSDYAKYSKYGYRRCYTRSASELHVIPEGERYLDMFRGEYAPVVVNNLYSLRNKRVLPAVTMVANFEELAYPDPGVDEENETYKDDADDCLKKILSGYPRENRRKRRRH